MSNFISTTHRNTPSDTLSDDYIVAEVLEGKTELYSVLVERYRRRVFSIARHFFQQPETVEDIAQESFSKAYFALHSYQRGASLEFWLARITVNNCYDELRRRKAKGELTVSDLTEDEVSWIDNRLSHVSLNHHHQQLDNEAAFEISEKLLAKLDFEDRLVLILLHVEEYSVAEIAKALKWSEAKVKIRAFRARHALRKVIKRIDLAEQRKQPNDTTITLGLHRSI